MGKIGYVYASGRGQDRHLRTEAREPINAQEVNATNIADGASLLLIPVITEADLYAIELGILNS